MRFIITALFVIGVAEISMAFHRIYKYSKGLSVDEFLSRTNLEDLMFVQSHSLLGWFAWQAATIAALVLR